MLRKMVFTKGMQFLITDDELLTGGWDENLSQWKGKHLTVKEVLDHGASCTVNENDEEWLLGDVDWAKMGTDKHYWWRIDTERYDYNPIVVCYTYSEVEHIRECCGPWFKFTRV